MDIFADDTPVELIVARRNRTLLFKILRETGANISIIKRQTDGIEILDNSLEPFVESEKLCAIEYPVFINDGGGATETKVSGLSAFISTSAHSFAVALSGLSNNKLNIDSSFYSVSFQVGADEIDDSILVEINDEEDSQLFQF